nr:phage antirepressor KilAC domain-containing protein [Myxococcus sp. CA040A]
MCSNNVMYREGGRLVPFAEYQGRGYFAVKAGSTNCKAFPHTRLTQKGAAGLPSTHAGEANGPIRSDHCPPNRCSLAASLGGVMNRMAVVAIAVAVLLAGAAVAVVVLRGRTVEGQAIDSWPSSDFATDLERRPKCWVKVKSSEPGKCQRIHKGVCYMANWAACAEYY